MNTCFQPCEKWKSMCLFLWEIGSIFYRKKTTIYNNICLWRAMYVCVYVCVCVCMCVIRNKKKYWTNFKNSFFPAKVSTVWVTWAILEVSPTTPSCRKPEKPSKNHRKPGFFELPRLYCKKFLHEFNENWLNGVKDIFAPKYEKRIKFAHNAELQESRF